jgi:xylulokinase
LKDPKNQSSSLNQIFSSSSFTLDHSPIWQDTSTTKQCQELESSLPGGQDELAQLTGSRAFERFTANQIMKIYQETPQIYEKTVRISLVSSFLCSILIGSFASVDVADASGMNLMSLDTKQWDDRLLIAAGGNELKMKLGEIDQSGYQMQGCISSWFVNKYRFNAGNIFFSFGLISYIFLNFPYQ